MDDRVFMFKGGRAAVPEQANHWGEVHDLPSGSWYYRAARSFLHAPSWYYIRSTNARATFIRDEEVPKELKLKLLLLGVTT
jgi:hypothetical protein